MKIALLVMSIVIIILFGIILCLIVDRNYYKDMLKLEKSVNNIYEKTLAKIVGNSTKLAEIKLMRKEDKNVK